MRHSSHHFYWAIAALLILFTGCAEEVALDNKEQPTSYISFVEQPNDTSVTTRSAAYNDHPLGRMVSVKDYTTTDGMPFRVELYEKEDEGDTMALSSLTRSTFYESFRVSCSVYPSTGTYTDYPCGNYFYQLSVMHNRPTAYFWPTDDYKLSFYACYPNSEFAARGPNGISFLGSATDNGMPIYKYKIPSQYNMTELKTANITDHPGGAQGPLSVTLKNRLAKITVIVTSNTDETGWFNPSPKFENIPTEGKLQGDTWFDVGNIGGHTWENYTANAVPFPAKNQSQGFGAFMFVPCELPDEAVLRLSLNYTQQYLSSYPPPDREFVISLAGQTWEAGKSYTYNVTVNPDFEYDLDISGPEDYTYSGGTKQYTVTSYKTKKSTGETFPVAWTAQFSEDNGTTWSDTPPSWLTAFTASDDGGTTAESYNATVTADVMVDNVETTATEMLKTATPVVDYDLSTNGGTTTRNTANCYIVSAPGTYKLPLVYGNAIKNGATNTQSYNPSGTSSETFLKPFINHAGTGITNPWLKNNGVTPNGAALIWQDCYPTDPETGESYSLIKNGSIHIGNAANGEDPDFLYFEITPEAITEGNALIAVRVGGTTVWSWHIWVTPREWEISELGDTNYKISKRNIGWVNDGSVYKKGYNGRKLLVKITQDEGQNSKTIAITQRKDEYINVFSWNGRCAQYQWGRKDPFMSGTGNEPKLYTVTGSTIRYYNYTYTATGTTTAYGTIENSIKMPTYTYRNNITNSTSKGGLYQSSKINLWGSPKLYGYNSGDIYPYNFDNIGLNIKTIYDPSPIGWKVLDPCLGHYIYQNSTWDGQGTSQGIYLQNEEIHINNMSVKYATNTGYSYSTYGSAHYFTSGMKNTSPYQAFAAQLSYKSFKFPIETALPYAILNIIPMSEEPVN